MSKKNLTGQQLSLPLFGPPEAATASRPAKTHIETQKRRNRATAAKKATTGRARRKAEAALLDAGLDDLRQALDANDGAGRAGRLRARLAEYETKYAEENDENWRTFFGAEIRDCKAKLIYLGQGEKICT